MISSSLLVEIREQLLDIIFCLKKKRLIQKEHEMRSEIVLDNRIVPDTK